MSVCKNCGAELHSGKFCSECGTPVESPSDPEQNLRQPIIEHPIKICTNCGDKLLPQAKKCPTCGKKALDCPIVDKNDKVKIEQIISSVPNPKDGIVPKWEQNLELMQQIQSKQKTPSKREIIAERKAKNKAEGTACCPKCGSTSLSANKKGFGIGKAVAGTFAVGPIGLVVGNIGAKKVWVTCLNCGHRWKI